MSFFCAISGEPPQVPVVSPKTGLVYERRLIVAHLNANGSEPSGETLSEDELIPVKTNPNAAPPRPPTLTSIPALLHTLQSEWDALVLETHSLRTQYNATRQELAHALYQSDAATRVVARLVRERDEAREALANVRAATGMGAATPATNGAAAADGDVEMSSGALEPEPLPEDVLDIIDETHKALSATRKKRKTPSVPSPARLPAAPTATYPSPSPITAFALSRLSASSYLTGSADGTVRLWDAGDSVASLPGHTGAVTALEWIHTDSASPYIASGGEDATVRIYSASSPASPSLLTTLSGHTGGISALAAHPSRQLLLSASQDGTYALHSLAAQKLISRSMPADLSSTTGNGYASLSVHPDGVLLALGLQAASAIQIFDIRTRALAATFEFPTPAGGVHTTSFSENGYSLASASLSASEMHIWDLRKLAVSRVIGASFPVSSLSYDHSSAYLVAGGEGGVGVWAGKTGERVWGGEGAAAVVKWGVGGSVWAARGEGVSVWEGE